MTGAKATPANAVDQTILTEAIRFRTEFALDTDLDLVAGLIASSDGNDLYGTPLTLDEYKLMQQRGEAQSALQAVRVYRDAHRKTLGGLWLTYSPGKLMTVNIGVTADDLAVEADLRSLVPDGADLQLVQVDRSQAQLDELIDRIAQDGEFFAGLGTTYRSASVDLAHNQVEVALSEVTEAVDQAVQERYGYGAVRTVVGGPVGADACTRLNCGPPWKGGIKIYPPDGTYCTSGFVVSHFIPPNIHTFGIWTAGHCESATWRQGSSSGTVIGTTSARYFGGSADVQVIPFGGVNATYNYLEGASNCSPCLLYDVDYKEGYEADEPGDSVCNNGAVSGTKCGTLSSTNVTFTYLGVTLTHMRRATYTRNPGDSGGPVTGQSFFKAAGSHTHYQNLGSPSVQYAIYSHVWEDEAASDYDIYLRP